MPNNKAKGYYQARTISVSQNRFSELLSLYLDNQATFAELELLAELVAFDKEAEKLFHKNLRMHYAMCKMYNKRVKLQPLPEICKLKVRKRMGVPRVKGIRKRAAIEWSLVLVFMLLTISFFKLSKTVMADGYSEAGVSVCDLPNLEEELDVDFNNNFMIMPEKNVSACSLISYKRRKSD